MRHGEATDNIREILSDKEIYFSILTDAGFSEAAQTIKSIDKVDKIYISPLPRTIQTAKILYEKFPTAEAVIDDRLREIQYGRYSGQKNNSSLDIIREKQIAGDYFTRFGKYGDNKFDIEMRLSLFLRDMSTRNFDNNTIAIVSHGSVISFMKRILNLKTPHTKTGKAEFFTINDWSDLNDRIKHLETIADARKHTFNREVDHIENVDVQNKYRYIIEELYNSVELPESTLGWLVKGHNDDLAVEQEATFDPNKPILICPFYNFDNFAQKWFEHYRGLGVVNYIMIDNNSTDLSLDIIKSQNNGLNIKIMKASGRYNCFRACGWRQQIMDKCGQNKWYLNVDSDELFSYDNSDRVNINDFIKKLDGFKLVKSLMVDVYPRGPALEVVKEDGGDEDDFSSLDADYESEGSESIDTDFDVDEYLYDDEPSYKTASSNFSADDEDFDNESLLTEGQSLYDYLMEQIHLSSIDDEDLKIAEYIIGNLDNDGYLRREIKAIVDDLAFSQGIYTTQEKVKEILENYVQKLDPAGDCGVT
jgi:broad specificity phosphatase PhoE